uniref:Uncharacterized protein n=1 Tax=Micrurus spixii TaxID=129469 RepID=A0A2D4LYA9_9SAUR
MGENLTKEQQAHVKEIGQIVESNKNYLNGRNYYPTRKRLIVLFKFIWQEIPTYPHKGYLDVQSWTKIGEHFHKTPRAPPEILITWKGVMMALENHLKKTNDKINTIIDPPPQYEGPFHGLPSEASEETVECVPSAPDPNPPLTTTIKICKNLYPSLPEKRNDDSLVVLEDEGDALQNLPDNKGPLQRGLEKARDRDDLEGDDWKMISAYPIDYSGANPVYIELPFQHIKEIKAALTMHGITSPYFKGMMVNFNNTYNLTPNEWRAFAKMILNITQYLLWVQAFEEACKDQHQRNPPHFFLSKWDSKLI